MRLRLATVTWMSIAIAASGCVSMTSVTPNPSENQSLNYYNGAGVLSSTLFNCTIQFGPLDEVQNVEMLTTFSLSISNHGTSPILVDPKSVSANTLDAKKKEKKLAVVDRNAAITAAEMERAQAAFAAGMAAASGAIAASQPTTTAGTVSSGGQTAYVNARTYNPAAAEATRQMALNNAMNIQNNANARYADQMSGRVEMLAKNTVMPGMTYSALLKVRPPAGAATKPTIAIYRFNTCGEEHVFNMTYDKGEASSSSTGTKRRVPGPYGGG